MGRRLSDPVVECIKTAYRQKGYTTLRFDFRGTGSSQGSLDDGRGEQLDVCAAISVLQREGIDTIDLAGYSFGAWVNAHVSSDQAAYKRMVMVSPPIGFISFAQVAAIPALSLVVTGSRDEIAPASKIRAALPGWNEQACFEIIDNADHFYSGQLTALEIVLTSSL